MGKRVIIIGGGVIGTSAAYFCAKAGHQVTVIERGHGRDGCSFGNAGMIVPSHFIPLAAPGMVALGLKWMWNPESPFYIKPRLDFDLMRWGLRFWRSANANHVRHASTVLRDMHLASRALFEELANTRGNDFGLSKKGLLMLCKTQHALDEEAMVATKANELGVPAEVLDARQTAALDPVMTMDVAGSVCFPKDCHLDPAKFVHALCDEATKLGVEFLCETETTGFAMEGGALKAVETPNGRIEGHEVVLCGGAWSAELAKALNLRLPMQAGKGYSLTLPQPRQLPQLCSILTEARVAVTPMGGALRVGGTMEIAGNDLSVNERRVRGITKAMPEYFPEFRAEDFAGIRPWSGLRPCSPDGLPYLGRVKNIRNLTIATGHAMMGLSLGPVTGRIVSQIISNEVPEMDLAMLSPERF